MRQLCSFCTLTTHCSSEQCYYRGMYFSRRKRGAEHFPAACRYNSRITEMAVSIREPLANPGGGAARQPFDASTCCGTCDTASIVPIKPAHFAVTESDLIAHKCSDWRGVAKCCIAQNANKVGTERLTAADHKETGCEIMWHIPRGWTGAAAVVGKKWHNSNSRIRPAAIEDASGRMIFICGNTVA